MRQMHHRGAEPRIYPEIRPDLSVRLQPRPLSLADEEEEQAADYDQGWHDGWHWGRRLRRVLMVIAVAMVALAAAIVSQRP